LPVIEDLSRTMCEVENATLVSQPPPGVFAYELKYDGYRILAIKVGNEVRLVSQRPAPSGARPDAARGVRPTLNSYSRVTFAPMRIRTEKYVSYGSCTCRFNAAPPKDR
jgi:hypothetical protein